MAGVNYYVDNVGGSAANSGLTKLLAKALPEDLVSVITNLDILNQKATGVDYTWTNATSAAQSFFGAVQILWTNYDTDGDTQPVNLINKNSSFYKVISTATAGAISKVQFKLNYSGSVNTATALQIANTSTTGWKFDKVKFKIYKTDNLTTAHIFQPLAGTNAKGIFTNCEVEGDDSTYPSFTLRLGNGVLSSFSKGSIHGLTIPSTTGYIGDCVLFYKNKVQVKIGGGSNYLARPQTNAVINAVIKNTFYIVDNASTTNRCIDYNITGQGQIIDNIFFIPSTGVTAAIYSIAAGSLTVQDPATYLGSGNNLFINTAGVNNITGLIEGYNASQYTTGAHPFLSIDPLNANFLNANSSNSITTTYIIGKSYFDTDESLGADQVNATTGTTYTFDRKMVDSALGIR